MSRLNNFLLEYGNNDRLEGKKHRSVPITEDMFLELKEKHCKHSMHSPLYRGISKMENVPYLFIDPSQHTRVSEYTQNWYMLLMELLSQWKKYPKFSKSVICSTSKSGGSDWGSLYQVYPYDGAILGVTPANHFWGSFDYSMPEMNQMIRMILNVFDISIESNETKPNVLKEMFDKINKADKEHIDIIKFRDEHIWCPKQVDDILIKIKKGVPVLEAFRNVLPANRFMIKKIGDKLPGNKEVWTESPCLLEKYRITTSDFVENDYDEDEVDGGD